jgi:nitroreductase
MNASPEDLTEFLQQLRQVREYTSEPVAEDVIRSILEVGRWSGTSANTQPTEVVVVRDAEAKRKLGDWGTKPAATCAAAFVIVSRNEEAGLDEGRLGERLMLAAWAHGLGAAFATLKNDGPDATKALLGIPADRYARVVVSIGHIDQDARRALPPRPGAGRKPLAEFAHWERYS